jgi:hypothetical protein
MLGKGDLKKSNISCTRLTWGRLRIVVKGTFQKALCNLRQNTDLPREYSGSASVTVRYLSLHKTADTLKRDVEAGAMETDRNKLC